MADGKLVNWLRQDVTQWNQWREENRGEPLDLSRAKLSRANLSRANLSRANLSHANLREANLSHANLREANLSHANLREANLSHANLREANLNYADLSYSNLNYADLSGALFGGTQIVGNDLRETKGLTTIRHVARSPVELFSVQLPQDGSALHFLRGVGVPDAWIAYYRAEMMHPIQYHSCFLSYSSQDEILAKRLHADLQAEGVRCWFAPEDMKTGDRMRKRIDEAIHLQDKLLLILSEHAIASTWVADEVDAAIEKEAKQQRDVLFPIRIDSSVMHSSEAWAAKLRRSRHIGDFTQWTDPQAYQQAFIRLLRDLKHEDKIN